VTPLLDETLKNQSVILRIHVDMYMPFMAALAQKMAAQKGEAAIAVDPEAPVIQMNQEVVELSSAPLEASLFEVPAGYTTAPPDDLIRSMVQTPGRLSADADSAGKSDGTERIRVGGDVQRAKLVSQPLPVYPPEAKDARISGHVVFNVIVGKDGTVHDVSLVSGHPLLVAPAKDAVKQWVYQPTLLNGEPVEVVTQVDVTFSLSP